METRPRHKESLIIEDLESEDVSTRRAGPWIGTSHSHTARLRRAATPKRDEVPIACGAVGRITDMPCHGVGSAEKCVDNSRF